MIIGAISECTGPNAEIANGVARLKKTFSSASSLNNSGRSIAIDVYSIAAKHPEVRQVVASVYLLPSTLEDQHGRPIKGDLFMGTITINDLDEVRRYADDSAYAARVGPMYAAQISQMDYGQYLRSGW